MTGTQSFPGSDGILCLSGNVARFNAPHQIVRGPIGEVDITPSSIDVNPIVSVQAGETWSFQGWYRDVGNRNNLSDAVELLFH